MKLRDLHQECISIVEAIEHFENRKEINKAAIEGFPGTFPKLRRKYEHELKIFDRCIERLKQRHDKKIIDILSLVK